MSRCFPYPPPGYTLDRATNQALIDSIKLQKEKEKSKEDRKKEKRKERKDKKKEKKEKRKEKKDKKLQSLEKSAQGYVGKQAETEQPELSNLTEEHGQPVCAPVPSSSYDSKENRNKRKRDSSPVDVNRGHGRIIRIRLSSKKQKEPDASANEQLCSTSGRPFESVSKSHDKDCNLRCRSDRISNINEGISLRTDREHKCSTSRDIDTAVPVKNEIPSLPNVTKMQKMELKYKNLVENLVPPQVQATPLAQDDDLDWLFQGKSKETRDTHAQRRQSDSTPTPCGGLWPRAQYLHGVDVYALPYTVPF